MVQAIKMTKEDFSGEELAGIKFILRALRYRNYRLFFVGEGISLVGSWMQIVAVSWLSYRLTDSAFILGLVGFSAQIPTFILAPIAGVFADRWNRRRLLIITQSLAMLQAFVLAGLYFSGIIAMWHIFVLIVLSGVVNAFDAPVRQAFIVDMVDKKEDLANAIALNSVIFNSARLLGASLAGIIVALTGEGFCFLLNGISFLAVIFALKAMRIKITSRHHRERKHVLLELKEGLRYAFNYLPIRYILVLVTFISALGMSYVIVMPVVAKEVLGGGAQTMGFLLAATGLGSLLGAFYLASRRHIHGLEKIIVLAAFSFGTSLVLFSFSRIFWLSFILMFCVGFGMIVQIASSNTLLQNLTDDARRGRVMSLYTVAFLGIVPFGNLLMGGLASKFGAQNTILFSGSFSILAAIFFAKRIDLINKAMVQKIHS